MKGEGWRLTRRRSTGLSSSAALSAEITKLHEKLDKLLANK